MAAVEGAGATAREQSEQQSLSTPPMMPFYDDAPGAPLGAYAIRLQSERTIAIKDLVETQSLRSGVVLLQSQSAGLEKPFGSHEIDKERHHEVSSYLRGH